MANVGSEIHLDDLARPRLPAAIRAFNAVAGPLMRWRINLEPECLLALAKEREGLEDFGEGGLREGLGVLCKALEEQARLPAARPARPLKSKSPGRQRLQTAT